MSAGKERSVVREVDLVYRYEGCGKVCKNKGGLFGFAPEEDAQGGRREDEIYGGRRGVRWGGEGVQ